MKRVILQSELIIIVMASLLLLSPTSDSMAALSLDDANIFKAQITAAMGDPDEVIKLVKKMITKHQDDAAEIAAIAAEIVPELAVDIAVAAAEMVPYLSEEIIISVSRVVPDQAMQVRYAVEALMKASGFSVTPILDEPQEIPAPGGEVSPSPTPPGRLPPSPPPPVTTPPTTRPYGQ